MQEGVEPNPGPVTDSKLTFTTISTQGVPGAWRALKQLSDGRILFLQDAPFTEKEFCVFAKHAKSRQYQAYRTPGRSSDHGARRTGGVVTLVPKNLNQQSFPTPVQSESVGEGYAQVVHVHGITTVNAYAPPGQKDYVADLLLQTLVSHKLENKPWLIAIDANEEPQNTTIGSTLTAVGGVLVHCGNPTRFEGNRNIDWFLTNRPNWFTTPEVNNKLHLSDHKAVTTLADVQLPVAQSMRYTPQPRWPKPSFLENETWDDLLARAWQEQEQHHKVQNLWNPTTLDYNINLEWSQFPQALSKTYRKATCMALEIAVEEKHKEEIIARLGQPGSRNGKGVKEVCLQNINHVVRKAGYHRTTFADRKIANRLARLHEAKRLLTLAIQKDHHRFREASPELKNLVKKLWPDTEDDNTLGSIFRMADSDLSMTKAERLRNERIQQTQRLKQWKQKILSSNMKQIGQWIKSKEAHHAAASVQHKGRIAHNKVQAAALIHQHWQEVWTEDCTFSAEQRARTLISTFPQSPRISPWPVPSCATFVKAVKKNHGAAGADSWAGYETAHMPLHAVQLLYQICLRWHHSEQIPSAFAVGRQVNIPKAHKIKEGRIEAKNTRPITILSIFWRAWASAWIHSPKMMQFAAQLPPEVAGVISHDGAEDAAAQLQDHFTIRGGVLISLDYSQCYDRMHTDTTAIFLQEIGWPPALTKQLQTVWATTRWIEFDNHVHPEPIVSRAVPQGCPLAPLALACWMCSGLQAVNNTLVAQGHSPNATRKAFCQCYMDDRTFVDADLNRGLDRAHAWWQWSPTVGLKENQDKTQFCAKSNKNRELLRQQHPEWVTTTVTALGVSIRAKPTKNTALEEERLEKTF